MRGYQAIPSAAADGIEGGVPSGDRGVSPGAPSANRADARAAPSWTSKLGCISLGMMAGCLLAGGLATRGPGADKDRARASTAARHQFSDALPFEEVNPLTWVSARKAGGTPKAKTPSLLASPWDAAASPPPAAPHLLYHAHEAAFLLLYDAAARSSSGSRLSEVCSPALVRRVMGDRVEASSTADEVAPKAVSMADEVMAEATTTAD